MSGLAAWWESLTTLNQWFYGVAAFFGVLFLWQMVMAFFGLGTETEVDIVTHSYNQEVKAFLQRIG